MPITISGDTPNFSAATITTGTVTTLNAPSGVLATQNGMTGIAKAWVTWNGVTTVTINGSFNVSSITRNGAGDYTLNFTTAMPNANYSVSGSTGSFSALNGQGCLNVACVSNVLGATTKTTTQLRVLASAGSTGTLADFAELSVMVIGT
jgi:hypothetical protein